MDTLIAVGFDSSDVEARLEAGAPLYTVYDRIFG